MEEDIAKFIPGDLLEFLANVAFVGIEYGRFDEAKVIFEVIVEICPDNINAKIAYAVGELMMCHIVCGTKMLFEILKQEPLNETVKGFLALAFKMGRVDQEALNISRHILQVCKDENMRTIAQGIIDSYQKPLTPHNLQAQQSILITQ